MMLTLEQTVFEIREAASAWGKEALACDRESLANAYTQDAIDLRLVADLLEEDCSKNAVIWARKLDTIVRECMPSEVWDYLDQFEEW